MGFILPWSLGHLAANARCWSSFCGDGGGTRLAMFCPSCRNLLIHDHDLICWSIAWLHDDCRVFDVRMFRCSNIYWQWFYAILPRSQLGSARLWAQTWLNFDAMYPQIKLDNIYICAQTWLYKNNLERTEMVHRIHSVWQCLTLFVEWACNFKWFSPNGLEAARIHA